jgi:hypothetical protein
VSCGQRDRSLQPYSRFLDRELGKVQILKIGFTLRQYAYPPIATGQETAWVLQPRLEAMLKRRKCTHPGSRPPDIVLTEVPQRVEEGVKGTNEGGTGRRMID